MKLMIVCFVYCAWFKSIDNDYNIVCTEYIVYTENIVHIVQTVNLKQFSIMPNRTKPGIPLSRGSIICHNLVKKLVYSSIAG